MNNFKRINWIIPMCGDGKRTQELGNFKPLIFIKDKTIFDHFLEGINHQIQKDDLIKLIIKKNITEYRKKIQILKQSCKKYTICKNIEVKIIDHDTEGPCDTIRNIINELKDELICLIINPDQKIYFEIERNLINADTIFLAIGFDNKKKSSYVLINKNSILEELKEKENISFYASTGVYIFGSNKLLKKCINDFYKTKIAKLNGEHYISHLVNNAIKNKTTVRPLETFLKYDLGNIDSIKNFQRTLN